MEYSDYIKELEKIVSLLESGECSMEECSKLFEQGTEIAKNLVNNFRKQKVR